ncbi:MAG: hypothetical protein K2X04_04715 [Burkholderiales bacterium]|nr:hypothetical protein [Burkholderiales bacterium]
MKKSILLIMLVLLVLGGGYFYFNYNKVATQSHEYSEAISQSESANSHLESSAPLVSLSDMLASGIKTFQGVLQSQKIIESASVENYTLSLDGKPLKVKSVSEIELSKAFLVEGNQVLLVAFDQGGNQCSRQYQVVTISESTTKVSKVFGSCLPLGSAIESGSQITFSMPQNNPYLGDDVLVNYVYQNGEVHQATKPQELKQKYAGLTANKILQIATDDGCYIDGVMLDDNSCGGGRKYCVMFKNLPKSKKTADYKFLKSFCK